MVDGQVLIKLSTVADGSMKDDENVLENRARFIASMNADPTKGCLVQLVYEGDDYCRYRMVDSTQGGQGVSTESTIIADALLTREKGMTLFLPLADCIGAVIWDKNHTALMVSHLGRHNLEQEGGGHSVEYFVAQTGIPLKDIRVYLTPAAGKDAYPIHSLGGKGLHETAVEQLISAGINKTDIKVDARDTTKDERLFSHSEFLKGNRQTNGRHAVFAMLKK